MKILRLTQTDGRPVAVVASQVKWLTPEKYTKPAGELPRTLIYFWTEEEALWVVESLEAVVALLEAA